MELTKALRDACIAAVLGAALVSVIAGCATARHRDWREAVKVGDYPYAYSDLFETWRAGTADVKAESLRYAWRDHGIVAAARKDLIANIQPYADRHTGDVTSFQRAIKSGPLEDRVDFAKLVDRNIDIDREIAGAFERHGQRPVARPAQEVKSAATVPSAEMMATPEKRTEAATVPPVPKPQPAETIQSAAKAEPVTKPEVAEKRLPTEKAEPAARSAAHADLLAQVAEARKHAVWRCKGAAACSAAWASAESFVARNSDRRIRTVSPTAIETYPPIVIGEIGMKVARIALSSEESELRLTVACRVGLLVQVCPAAELRIYTAFPPFMRSSIAP